MVDIIDAYNNLYENITLITGDLNLRNKPLPESIKISRIVSPKRNRNVQRISTWTIGFFQIFWKLLWTSNNSDLFIVSNPPMAVLLPLFFRNNFSLLLFDIYPDALVEHKILSSRSVIIRFWAYLNRKVFRRAKVIFTLTDGMKLRASQYVNNSKIQVVPIWTDNAFFKPIKRSENIFIREHELENKFIVMYSGNLGHTHNIEALVDLASELKDEEIEVLIIGEGSQKNSIKNKIASLGIKNCIQLPWQEVNMLPYSFAAADIGVVSLGSEASTLSLPSKTFNLMSAGKPILSISGENSELSRIIKNYDIGKSFDSSDLAGMVEYVRELYMDKKQYDALAVKSKRASLDFTPENAKRFVI